MAKRKAKDLGDAEGPRRSSRRISAKDDATPEQASKPAAAPNKSKKGQSITDDAVAPETTFKQAVALKKTKNGQKAAKDDVAPETTSIPAAAPKSKKEQKARKDETSVINLTNG